MYRLILFKLQKIKLHPPTDNHKNISTSSLFHQFWIFISITFSTKPPPLNISDRGIFPQFLLPSTYSCITYFLPKYGIDINPLTMFFNTRLYLLPSMVPDDATSLDTWITHPQNFLPWSAPGYIIYYGVVGVTCLQQHQTLKLVEYVVN